MEQTDTNSLADELAKALPLIEDLETGQDCEEYAYANGKFFQAMTHAPEAFDALKHLPAAISVLRHSAGDASTSPTPRGEVE